MHVQRPNKIEHLESAYSLNTEDISDKLKVVKSKHELNEVREFRKTEYSKLLPDIKGFFSDPHDDYSVTLFSRDASGNISSTGRLAFDGPLGLPEENLVADLIIKHRKANLKLAEYGRLIIRETGAKLVKEYYKSIYLIAINNGIDSVIVVSKKKDIYFYEKLIGTKVLSTDVNETFGGTEPYACLEWRLEETRPRFFKWCQMPQPPHLVD